MEIEPANFKYVGKPTLDSMGSVYRQILNAMRIRSSKQGKTEVLDIEHRSSIFIYSGLLQLPIANAILGFRHFGNQHSQISLQRSSCQLHVHHLQHSTLNLPP